MTDIVEFDLTGPLPTGTCLLEASAGTGKTYAIAALATRYIAEGHFTIDQLIIVTFGRMATAELRSRVHGRLRATARALQARLAGTPHPGEDGIDRLICEVSPAEQVRRLERLTAALLDIDSAIIATTHQFCSRMLNELGLLVDHDATTRFVENPDDLVDQVTKDLYVARLKNEPDPVAFELMSALVKQAIEHIHLPVHPPDGENRERVELARIARDEVRRRMRQQGLFTFDDQVSRLADALADPATSATARAVLTSRFPVVLIDEFQDTDPLQWHIIRDGFVGRSTVVLIGDPKQSIYAFRDADVRAYLDAVSACDHHFTLATNRRSDKGVVDGVQEIFAEAALGDERIMVRPVTAARTTSRLHFPVDRPVVPVVIRFPRQDASVATRVDAVRPLVDVDLVHLVRNILAMGIGLDTAEGTRPLTASDIAVLVRTNRRGAAIHRALVDHRVPAVFSGTSSVFTSTAASDWQSLLRALVDPRRPNLIRAATSSLVGTPLVDLASEDVSTEVSIAVKRLSTLLHEHGVMAVFEAANSVFGVQARVLQDAGGERLLTDLRHVAQLLNDASVRDHLAPQALVEWLGDRIAEKPREGSDERSRRLETDRDAVQIMTVHRAKGLEFPVVLLPEAADCFHGDDQAKPRTLHVNGVRVLDTGQDADRPSRHADALREDGEEELRDLYVAMTRATGRLVMWWARTTANTHESPLHRLLARDRIPGVTPDLGYPSARDPLDAGLDPSLVDVRAYTPVTPPATVRAPEPARALAVREFRRNIDQTWRRTSYSGLTSQLHGMPSSFVEMDEPPLENEPLPTLDPTAVASALAPLPGGTEFGTLVHAILEQVDPGAADLASDVAGLVRHWASRSSVGDLDPDALATGLVQVLETPLGALAPGVRLRDIARRDRLAELDFELPMGRGNVRTVNDLASVFTEHVPASHLLGPYGNHLGASPAADRTLHGFLTGSIDAVLRVGTEPRHLIVDYKTNRMPVLPGETLTVDHYRPEAMARAMMDAHYPLQALLYGVALHRHLARRLPGYDPDVHLGGVGYLFVRGMAGAETPVHQGMPTGVFTWHPSPDLIRAASAVLEGGTR